MNMNMNPANDTGWHPGALDWIAAHAGDIAAVIMQTERDNEGVSYEVLARDRTVSTFEGSEDLRSVWSASVRFGHTDATVAGGAAFRSAAREQEKATEHVSGLVRLAGWKPPSTDTLKDRGAWP